MLTRLPADDKTYRLIQDWLAGYIMKPHDNLGRAGPVCPFVGKAMRSSSIFVAAAMMDGAPDGRMMEDTVAEAITHFHSLARDSADPEHTALIVAFPQLSRHQWHLIDEVHRHRKTAAVRDGLMLGQFHPECTAPAVHNPDFAVNRAPLGLIVIRHIAAHDFLFLDTDPVWMHYYDKTMHTRGMTGHHHSPSSLSGD